MLSGEGYELRVKRITQTSFSFGCPVTAVGLELCLSSMYVCSVYIDKGGRDLWVSKSLWRGCHTHCKGLPCTFSVFWLAAESPWCSPGLINLLMVGSFLSKLFVHLVQLLSPVPLEFREDSSRRRMRRTLGRGQPERCTWVFATDWKVVPLREGGGQCMTAGGAGGLQLRPSPVSHPVSREASEWEKWFLTAEALAGGKVEIRALELPVLSSNAGFHNRRFSFECK